MIKKRNHRFIYVAVVFLIALVVLSFAGVFVDDLAGEAHRRTKKFSRTRALKTPDKLIDKDFNLLRNHIISSRDNKIRLMLKKGIRVIPSPPNLGREVTGPLYRGDLGKDITVVKHIWTPKQVSLSKDKVFTFPYKIDFPLDMTFSEPVPVIFELTKNEVNAIKKIFKSASNNNKDFIRITLIDKDNNLLQYVPFDLNNFQVTNKLEVMVTHTYFNGIAIIFLKKDGNKKKWDTELIIDENHKYPQKVSEYFEDLPTPSICMWDSPKKKCIVDGMIGQSCCAKECGADFSCDGKQPGDNCGFTLEGGLKICDPNCGCVAKSTIQTCSDNIKNQEETGIDCGGQCAPCNTICETDTIYSPPDSGCTKAWPIDDEDDDEKYITNNYELGHKCEIMEICSQELDYIIQEASDCCAGKLNIKHSSSSENGCEWAKKEAKKFFVDKKKIFGDEKKTCRGFYIIKYMSGLRIERKYKRYGNEPYYNCYFDLAIDDEKVPHEEHAGTCGPKELLNPNVYGLECLKLPCESSDADPNTCFTGLGWNSDTDMTQNACFPLNGPTHAIVNIMGEGSCTQNSLSALTLLRKAGFSGNDVFVAKGNGHTFSFLKFPGDLKFHAVDFSSSYSIIYTFHGLNDGPGVLSFCDPLTKYYNDKKKVTPETTFIDVKNINYGPFLEKGGIYGCGNLYDYPVS
ncbi:hypothetical protein HOC35_07390 [Candidatus Woesearchaeota archaeon]|jgi:hypothetical protein|nr:hypothetical protein [Candidatus Woesearchaeota archaeon]